MHRRRSFEEPFGWWGPVWDEPTPRPLPELVREGVMSTEVAALLAELVSHRASIVVAAGPSGAGKTTLLTALLDYLPPETIRVYLRGCYEPFDFLHTSDPQRTTLLVNEISGHLPIYLWGPAVARVLGAARRGFQLAATAHARSSEEFVHGLSSYPLHVPAEDLRAVDLLVLLDARPARGGIERMVRSVVSLSTPAGPGQVEPSPLATWNAEEKTYVLDLDAVRRLHAHLGAATTNLDAALSRRASLLAHAS